MARLALAVIVAAGICFPELVLIPSCEAAPLSLSLRSDMASRHASLSARALSRKPAGLLLSSTPRSGIQSANVGRQDSLPIVKRTSTLRDYGPRHIRLIPRRNHDDYEDKFGYEEEGWGDDDDNNSLDSGSQYGGYNDGSYSDSTASNYDDGQYHPGQYHAKSGSSYSDSHAGSDDAFYGYDDDAGHDSIYEESGDDMGGHAHGPHRDVGPPKSDEGSFPPQNADQDVDGAQPSAPPQDQPIQPMASTEPTKSFRKSRKVGKFRPTATYGGPTSSSPAPAAAQTLAASPPNAVDMSHPLTNEGSSQDCASLGSLYASMGGVSWVNTAGWISGLAQNCCNWYGVSCDTSSRVTALDLAWNGLKGPLPASMFALSGLTRLNISYNALESVLPDSFGSLTSLTQLFMDSAGLQGPLPASLMSLTNLQSIHLTNNTLSGRLSFTASQNLSQLYAAQNAFTTLELSASPALTKVSIDHNQFSGALPDFSGAINLQVFTAASNAFTGNVFSLSNLAQLQRFDVSANQLEGPYPDPSHSTQLQSFAVDSNNWSGPFPVGQAPMYLANCQVGTVAPANCPSSGVLSDPGSLASKCAVNCIGSQLGRPNQPKSQVDASSLEMSNTNNPNGPLISSGQKRRAFFGYPLR